MKATEEQLKQIILEEVQKYLEEVEVAKKLQNIRNMSVATKHIYVVFLNSKMICCFSFIIKARIIGKRKSYD